MPEKEGFLGFQIDLGCGGRGKGGVEMERRIFRRGKGEWHVWNNQTGGASGCL